MTKRIALVIEGTSDARTAKALAERVVREEGYDPQEKLTWEQPMTWKQAARRREELGIKVHGHFDGEPGDLDARSTRSVLMLLDRERPSPDAVVLMRDADRHGAERKRGIEQARREHETKGRLPARVVLGLANPKREAWILVGFDAADDNERHLLVEEQRRLGFDPTQHPHRLCASTHGVAHDIKLCVGNLGLDSDREVPCYGARSLDELRQRGRETGLPEYLEEVRDRICTLLGST